MCEFLVGRSLMGLPYLTMIVSVRVFFCVLVSFLYCIFSAAIDFSIKDIEAKQRKKFRSKYAFFKHH